MATGQHWPEGEGTPATKGEADEQKEHREVEHGEEAIERKANDRRKRSVVGRFPQWSRVRGGGMGGEERVVSLTR